MEKCEICGNIGEECTCCDSCGHICPLDWGELFCPICKPEPKNSEKLSIDKEESGD